jgi:nucleobase:cation symporter-1, NCS1 family
MTAILMTDYYIVRRRNVSVPDMYDFHGIYRYSARYATNWRAVVALVLGFLPPLPGFIDNINSSTQTVKHHIVSPGGQHLFAIGYIYSFIAAGVFYVALMRFFPHQESKMDHAVTGEDIISANDERRISLTPPMKKTLINRIFAK